MEDDAAEELRTFLENPFPNTELNKETREVVLLLPGTVGEGYSVDLDRIKDASDLLGWLEHLSHKLWFTSGHMRELIIRVASENGIKINRAF